MINNETITGDLTRYWISLVEEFEGRFGMRYDIAPG
jgi:hypothetical protein